MTILDDAREGMDLSVRPQDDLFGHVNGTWLATAEIPADKSAWGPFAMLADQSEAQVRAIIEELAASGGEPGSEAQKIGDLFASFMDIDAVNARGAAPLEPWFAKVDAIVDLHDVAAFLGEFERLGGGGFFGSYIDNDDKDSSRYIFNLLQGGIGLPDESYYREEKFADIRAAYETYLDKLFTLGGLPDGLTCARTVIGLETEIALGHWARELTRDSQKTYNLKTLAEITELAAGFDFGAYIGALAGGARTAEQLLAEATVREPSFFDHLSKVLAATPIEDVRIYLKCKVLKWAASYLTDDFVELNFDFYGRTLNGTPELRERWKRGVSLVEGALGEAVGKEYAARHFPAESKAMMEDLVANLLAAYRASIEKLDWMGEETKQKAYAKLDTFMPKIGYPNKWKDYSALTITADDLLTNIVATSAWGTDRELEKIGKPVDRDEWFMLPQTVNAYYNPGTNEICFPAGILQKPFFAPDAEVAENYGGIGAVIGHEVGHGFDDQGAQFDPDGNLNDWWTAEDKAAFEVKTKALVAQYDGFSPRDLPGEHVNGQLTVGENIGDLGGLTIALKAFNLAAGGSASAEDQTKLFLNWAHVWRGKRRKEQLLQLITVDPHSPAEFRANIVRNLDEFHDLFETKPGDGLWLDPAERVRIW
ncbi:putative zinc metalloprotease [Nocardioides baekrokdamisoli]|uniref:Putative zinc metalloprotease n=1 Tax=Nocardioides baekrokdamisoli TaxID=1804624 RepID=A0A3G9J126_9ACTN|nr:M13-type metalloendopeptidase [Nocardioides baekrokdamisoli]BBH17338.1 putative zinc metalloprotease [Nocardioides baekrokdamisoli]